MYYVTKRSAKPRLNLELIESLADTLSRVLLSPAQSPSLCTVSKSRENDSNIWTSLGASCHKLESLTWYPALALEAPRCTFDPAHDFVSHFWLSVSLCSTTISHVLDTKPADTPN